MPSAVRTRCSPWTSPRLRPPHRLPPPGAAPMAPCTSCSPITARAWIGVVGRCAEVIQPWGDRLLIEQTGTAGFLLPALDAQAGVAVETFARRRYVEACAALDAAVSARTVRHG